MYLEPSVLLRYLWLKLYECFSSRLRCKAVALIPRHCFHIYRQFRINCITRETSMNLTQETLAQQSGVSRAVIAHIERQARNPSLHTLARLAASLDLSLEALLSK